MSELHSDQLNPPDEVQEASGRVFKTRLFTRFARQSRISDADLCAEVARMRRGLVEADLGGGVVKQRIARPRAGRAGGFRTIVAFQLGHHTFFVYGFAKSERENIRPDELADFRKLAKSLLEAEESGLRSFVELGELIEVKCDEKDLQN